VRTCAGCKHWTQTSTFPHYDGGVPGRCLAPVPVWVEYLWGVRELDRRMMSKQTADQCETYAEKDGE